MLGTQTPPSPSVRSLASLPLSACPARLLPRTSPAGDSPVPPGTCCAPLCDTIPPCSCARFRQPSGTAGCGTLRSLGVPDAALLDVSGAPEQSVRCCSPCVCRSRPTGRSVRLVRALCRGGLFTTRTCRRESRLHADGAGASARVGRPRCSSFVPPLVDFQRSVHGPLGPCRARTFRALRHCMFGRSRWVRTRLICIRSAQAAHWQSGDVCGHPLHGTGSLRTPAFAQPEGLCQRGPAAPNRNGQSWPVHGQGRRGRAGLSR